MKHLICQEFSHKKQIYIFSLLYVKVIAWTCGKDERISPSTDTKDFAVFRSLEISDR